MAIITQFEISNFKSILTLKLDFSFAEARAPVNYRKLNVLPFIDSKAGRFVPCLVLYGPNASGKSNVLYALAQMRAIAIQGIKNQYFPNRLNPKFRTTKFSLAFYYRDKLFNYWVEYDSQTIVYEELRVDDQVYFKIEGGVFKIAKTVIKGSYTFKKLKEIWNVECKDFNNCQKLTFLAKIGQQYAGLNSAISEAFTFFKHELEIYPVNEFPIAFGLEKLAANDDKVALNLAFGKVAKILQWLDFDISRMSYGRDEISLNQMYTSAEDSVHTKNGSFLVDYVRSFHKDIHGKEVEFNFEEESGGTKIVSGLLGVFLAALEQGKVIVLDELGRALHPLLLIELIRLFKDRRYNQKGAQLIFTAHNTDILEGETLRMSEIGIVQKTLEQGTIIHRIVDFNLKPGRNNFRQLYLNGAFAGIPFSYI